jgi:hypothetical protein
MGVMGMRRLVLAGLVSLGAFAGSVLFSAPVALAVTPPVVEEAFVSNVASSSATLEAKIDPEGNETTYRFEYGTSTAYGSSVPVPDGIVGSDTTGVAVSAHPQGLSPYTTYHYRVVAVVVSRSETVPGTDGTFTTQRAGGEFALPDGRQWELVSPPNKHGALISWLRPFEGGTGPLQAAADGSGIAYQVSVPTEAEPAGYAQQGLLWTQVRSDRGPEGWSTQDIAVPRNSPTGPIQALSEYLAFSRDLSSGLVEPLAEGKQSTLLSDEASESTIYLRREGLCDTPATASSCYLPLLTGKEGFADVPPGTKFGPGVEGFFQSVWLEGSTPDMSKVVLLSRVALTATPLPLPTIEDPQIRDLYEWSAAAPVAERLQLVSVLPASEGGGPASGIATVGQAFVSPSGARNSISQDGSRVFWSEEKGSSKLLYMRDTARGESVRLDVQQPGAPAGGLPLARFQFASSDGSRVFFTDSQRLTAQSGASQDDLYECVIVEEAGGSKCDLTDLTPERAGHSAEVQKFVLGASEDGSYVYFVANGVLSENRNSEGETATQGECDVSPLPSMCNLYEYHDGVVTFVARLSTEDEFDWDHASITSFVDLTSRVSPDGHFVAFMSDRPLTGYDNRDMSSGKPDIEVYLYDAQGGRLVCASCNPTGSRPAGVEASDFDPAVNKKKSRLNLVAVQPNGFGGEAGYSNKNWVAANLPRGDEVGGGILYQPRALSDGGRLFFNSSDALVPQDVNGEEDVYEFEPEGTGSCRAASVTFVSASGGCVSLISAGTSSEESGFLDASEGGGDVFFLTSSRLASLDVDTALDIYDAHACTVSVPCIAAPVGPPPCDSGDSCKGAPAIQPSIFGAPASATFVGAGNVTGSSSVPVVKPRSLSRAQKLARALRECKRKPRRKRGVCMRRARARYVAKSARKSAGGRARG